MTAKLLKPKLYREPPSVCIKPGCECRVFLPHEEGWQCFNCMKIIYKAYDIVTEKISVRRYSRKN